jgi:hypothetical protein
MDKLWFTNEPVRAFLKLLSQVNIFLTSDPPELKEWGNLGKLGNLRIQVDGRTVFDGPITTWFSGEAQKLTPALKDILVWRYDQFGSNGNIIPIPYQQRLKISVYGGVTKPRWFMATGLSLPPETKVSPYAGDVSVLPLALQQRSNFPVPAPSKHCRSKCPRRTAQNSSRSKSRMATKWGSTFHCSPFSVNRTMPRCTGRRRSV